MKTLRLGWQYLQITEKLGVVISVCIGCLLSYIAVSSGKLIMTVTAFGPIVLMVFAIQSTMMTGVMRFRSIAMNHILVEMLKEVRDARGGHVPEHLKDLLAGFLGDKK